MAMTTATMKVQTTVFVGNISEKASDTLVRQILLVRWKLGKFLSVERCVTFHKIQRCGQIEGWKRVKDASGKLQGSILLHALCVCASNLLYFFHFDQLLGFVSMLYPSPL